VKNGGYRERKLSSQHSPFLLICAGAALSPYSAARTMTVYPSEAFAVDRRAAFDDVEDIIAVPALFSPGCHVIPWRR
jgi:hypothetical protein